MRAEKNTDSAIWMHRRRFPDCAGIKRNPYYIAVPVLCGVVAQLAGMNHWRTLSYLLTIEQSRPRFESLIRPSLDEADLTAYQAALDGLLPHLPAQLRMQDDSTGQGFDTVQNILALMAFATGQQWAGILQLISLIDFQTGRVAPVLEDAAAALGRNDLPNNLKAEWQAWWDSFNAQKAEPFEDLEF